MTYDYIVQSVMDRLNLTSPTARQRIGESVNDLYRELTASIGVITSRRVDTTITVDPTDVDSTLPVLVIPDMEKVLRVMLIISATQKKLLVEETYDEITERATGTDVPRKWAVQRVGSGSVTIVLDSFTPTDSFDLLVEGYNINDILEGDAEPAFPASYHSILVEGVMSDELMKMEKPQLASIASSNYERKLSDLRMFLAKSSYLDIYQAKKKPRWYWP